MKRYSADTVLEGLKDFQRNTVDHVIDRFFGDEPTRRFLVADETGLGKSVVARGVIAKTLERLQDDRTVKRVDVVYVCSNQDIAAQNLARLRVTPDETIALSSRLTMLAKHSHQLASAKATVGKPVNLVAFTPGTSFDRGWRTGKAAERAMLYLLLEEIEQWDGWQRRTALRVLQGTTSTPDRFAQEVEWLRPSLRHGIDRRISREFAKTIRSVGLRRDLRKLIEEVGRSRFLPRELKERSYNLIAGLRAALAKAGVETLEPDLVILDEFQRFRHLLSVEDGGESAELAHDLFDYGDAKVLLLSATPYKPYTLAEEGTAGDDHHRDFRRTLSFLCADVDWNARVTKSFADYRDAVTRGEPVGALRDELRSLLLRVMCRTERPAIAQQEMLREIADMATDMRAEDIRGYVALRRVADAVQAPATVEYWKSAPYFLNFTEGYKLGENLRAALRQEASTEALTAALRGAQVLDTKQLRRYRPLDPGNARLRHLTEDTIGRGWWRLLWLPPSMPHYQLIEPFASAAREGITKRLIFSSWTATPTAVAGLLSYEAERRIVGSRLSRNSATERGRVSARLDFRLDPNGRPGAMSTLALFWPHPGLADGADPLGIARRQPDVMLSLREAETEAAERLFGVSESNPDDSTIAADETFLDFVFGWPGGEPPADCDAEDIAAHLARRASTAGQDDPADENEEPAAVSKRLLRHVEAGLMLANETVTDHAGLSGGQKQDLVSIAMHAPGNVAWRALAHMRGPGWSVTPAGHWRAAAVIASGFRSLFNRIESTFLLDQLKLDETYWRAVLRYCAAGGVQALLDEFLHHLRSTLVGEELDDRTLMGLAQHVNDVLSIRPSTYRAFDPAEPNKPIPLLSRFALRYGGRRDDSDGARQPEVRNAFNSPFLPFVVATTSAGQEGIDFHWWCSAVVHWNTPANPVDFEQREGRVHRFGGHAVRRNVAAAHRATALAGDDPDVWRTAYDAARSESGELGDFAPYWVYPGDAKIERHVMPYPLSRDIVRLDNLKDELALYRLAFGQPRQEDMIELLRRRGVTAAEAQTELLDLRPDSRPTDG